MGYLNMIIEYFRDKVLGQESPQHQQGVPAQGYGSYAQDLLSRFAMPAARGTSDGGIYGMFAGAMSAGRTRDVAAEAASVPDSLVHEQVRGNTAEKSKAISAQRERLTHILKSLEQEQQNVDLAYGSQPGAGLRTVSGGLKTKSKSEQSFENVSYDEASGTDEHPPKKVTDRRSTSGNWLPAGVGGWWAGQSSETGSDKKSSPKQGWSAAKDMVDAMTEGSSTGYDRR